MNSQMKRYKHTVHKTNLRAFNLANMINIWHAVPYFKKVLLAKVNLDWYGINYLANPKAASVHRYFRRAAAPASGNTALTLLQINSYNLSKDVI